MMAKIKSNREKQAALPHDAAAGSARTLSVVAGRRAGAGYPAAVMWCLLLIACWLLLLAPPVQANLPTIETLPPIDSHLNLPSGVAVGNDEKIYVASSNNNWVRIFSKSGQYQDAIFGLDGPTAVAVDAAGRVYVSNAKRGNVEVYAPDRSLIGKLGAGDGEFFVPVGVAVDSAGLIYVVDRHNEVKVYHADRTLKYTFGGTGTGNGQFRTPTAIAINEATGEILVSDLVALSTSARVQVFDLNGVFKRSFITTGTNDLGETVPFLRPYGIAVDTLDRIYVTDGYQNVVTVYGSQGNYLGKLYDNNRPLRNPQGIAFAPGTSRLFVASPNTHTVETFGIDSLYGNIAVSPLSHDFGSVTVNESSASQRFDLSNDGSGDLIIQSVGLTGADASAFTIVSSDCAARTLAPAAGCTIEVAFQPLAAGGKSALLTIDSDDLYAPVLEVALSGQADPRQYRLTVAKAGAGNGTVQASGINCGVVCAADYAEGTMVTLSALPDAGATFAGWSGAGCSGTATCTVTLGQALTVTATFDAAPPPPVTYSIIASAGDHGSISPVGTVTGNAGVAVAFTITADADYSISDVLVDGVSVGAVSSYRFDNLSADHTITAQFTADAQQLQLSSIEMGEVSVGDQWKQVSFTKTFIDPVVVVKPASLNDSSPAVVRVRNVNAQGFEVRIQEWEYLAALLDNSAAHAEEQIGYVVMEKGSYQLEDGTRIEAGRFDTNAVSNFETVAFAQLFTVPPIVVSSVVTYNEEMAVVGRMGDVSTTGFGYMLQEQGLNEQTHAQESVSFIAWEPSQSSQNGISFEVGSVNDVPTQQSRLVTFSGSYQSPPLFIADLQTTHGGTVNLRWSDKSATEVNVLLDQEQSSSVMAGILGQDASSTTSTEGVGYLILWSAEMQSHNLTVSKAGQGSGLVQTQAQDIDCGTTCSNSYSHGATVTLTAVADSGSQFSGWSGAGCSGTESCVVTMDQAVTVTATFDPVSPVTYTITASAGMNGTISPSGTQSVDAGSSLTYSITADTGYHVVNVTVDGTSLGAVTSYQFKNVDSDHVISALFDVDETLAVRYTITASAGSNGAITPSGEQLMDEGTTPAYSIAAEAGYHIADVLVDGVSVGAVESYQFAPLDADHTIMAQFDVNLVSYTITASAGSNGTVTPSGERVVNKGATLTYNIAADQGYHIANVTVDGVSQGAIASYEFPSVDANHTVSATFAINLYSLTVEKEGLGSGLVQAQDISCGVNCSADYPHGSTITLTAVADADSYFAGWSGGGCSGTESCVVTMDQAVTVTATFDPVQYTITASAGSNGTITPSGEQVASKGETLTYNIVADAGYHIVNVVVDGEVQGIIDKFQFADLDASHSISATFASNEFKLTDIAMGEVSVGHEWEHVTLDRFFADPVVVAKPASLNDAAPAVVRIRNVSTQGFDLKIQEWDYLDGVHANELVSYIVMERGAHVLKDGTRIEAGRFETNSTDAFETILFERPKAVSPVILSSIVSYNEEDAVIGRIKSVNKEGFQYMLREQAGNTALHATETVSYIAWESSIGRMDGISFEVGCLGDVAIQQSKGVDFIGGYASAPLFVADLQTAAESAAVNLRWSNKDEDNIDVLIDQEKSQLIESAPSSVEELGYLVLAKQVDATCGSGPESDCDGDGLTDDDERNIYGTDPNMANTDGDFWDDGKEVNYWMGRWNQDDDNDGLINLLDIDSNNDGEYDGASFAGNTSVKARGCGSTAAAPVEKAEDTAKTSRSRDGRRVFDRKPRKFEKRRGFVAPKRTIRRHSGFRSPAKSFERRAGFD